MHFLKTNCFKFTSSFASLKNCSDISGDVPSRGLKSSSPSGVTISPSGVSSVSIDFVVLQKEKVPAYIKSAGLMTINVVKNIQETNPYMKYRSLYVFCIDSILNFKLDRILIAFAAAFKGGAEVFGAGGWNGVEPSPQNSFSIAQRQISATMSSSSPSSRKAQGSSNSPAQRPRRALRAASSASA